MDYPHITPHVSEEELFEHFSLTGDERYFLQQLRKEKNVLGFAVLLKTFSFLGYPPRKKEDISNSIISWLSQQLKVNPTEFDNYQWKSRLWDFHLAAIRDFTGFRPATGDDNHELVQWLVDEAGNYPTRSKMFLAAIRRCRHIRIELPTEQELQRLVSSAWQQYFNLICQKITERLAPEIRAKMDQCLTSAPNDTDRYEWMKAKPGKFGMKSILREIKKIQLINSFEINPDVHLRDVPNDVLKLLRDRAAPEGSYQMRRHPPSYRYALMAALLHFRRMEVTDNITDIFLDLVSRIEKKADKKLERDLVRSIGAVYKKGELLYKIAKASTQSPHDTVENVVFPAVGEDTLQQIVEE